MVYVCNYYLEGYIDYETKYYLAEDENDISNLFNAEIYFLSQLPAKVDPLEVLSIVILALSLSFLATLYPSWRAARLEPVEALRYE